VRLIHAAEEQVNLIIGQIAIVIEVDDIESLSDVIV
jgi:hypothetical protein